jgi:16S rRNA (guanine966-N2)-methyltransferase
MNQTIRIIGGKFRGKKLHFPNIEGLRPTPDRVRETVFNWLMHDIRGARCLDAFAGSGALGFESFSREASKVILLEQEPSTYANLVKIVNSFRSSNLLVKKTNTCEFLQKTAEEFDIIFLDPPFKKDFLPQCLEIITHSPILISGGLLYIEASNELILNPLNWQTLKIKTAGAVVYGLYRKLKYPASA